MLSKLVKFLPGNPAIFISVKFIKMYTNDVKVIIGEVVELLLVMVIFCNHVYIVKEAAADVIAKRNEAIIVCVINNEKEFLDSCYW